MAGICRLDELKAAGCDRPECVPLATRVDLDLGEAVDLIERGCPSGLALAILR